MRKKLDNQLVKSLKYTEGGGGGGLKELMFESVCNWDNCPLHIGNNQEMFIASKGKLNSKETEIDIYCY